MPVGISVGLGRIAELQLDTGYTWFGIDSRDDAPLAFRVPADVTRTSDVIDLTVATKIRICGEGRVGRPFAVRFATRLPNASNESGLGLDTTDFSFSILGAQDIRVMARHGQRRPRHPEQPARCHDPGRCLRGWPGAGACADDASGTWSAR